MHHFSQKFHDAVRDFVLANRNDPEKIRKAIKHYSAGTISQEELVSKYKPRVEADIKERMADLQESYGDVEDVATVTFHTNPILSQFEDTQERQKPESEPDLEKPKPTDDKKPG